MWKSHDLWRHKNNRDVAFSVLSSFYIKEKDAWSLKVMWWNVGSCHKPWCLFITQRLTVSNQDRASWLLIERDSTLPPPEHVHVRFADEDPASHQESASAS